MLKAKPARKLLGSLVVICLASFNVAAQAERVARDLEK